MGKATDKITELGYDPLFESEIHDARQIRAALLSANLSVPDDYREFLERFPSTGIFNVEVAFAGGPKSQYTPKGLYDVSTLYALHDGEHKDLFALHATASGAARRYLRIGNDAAGNEYAIDLEPSSFGHVVCFLEEDSPDSPPRHLADSFTAFIEGLVCLDDDGRPL